MKFRIIELPPFTAITSGVDPHFDFSEQGILGRFSAYFSAIKPAPQDSFRPRDFLFYDKKDQGLVWWWVLAPGMDYGGYDKVEFEVESIFPITLLIKTMKLMIVFIKKHSNILKIVKYLNSTK